METRVLHHMSLAERVADFAQNVVKLKMDLFSLPPYVCVLYKDWEDCLKALPRQSTCPK